TRQIRRVRPISASEQALGDPLPSAKTIKSFTGRVAMNLARRVNRAAVKVIQMGAWRLCWLVDAEALHGQLVGHNTAKTAAAAAVGAKLGHWRTSSLRMGKMTRRYWNSAV